MEPYLPQDVFVQLNQPIPKVLVSPQRYIQGPGVINHIGSYLSLLNVKSAGLLASERGLASQGAIVLDSLKHAGIGGVSSKFNGECSRLEIETHVEYFRPRRVGCLIAAGGGKLTLWSAVEVGIRKYRFPSLHISGDMEKLFKILGLGFGVPENMSGCL